MRQWDLWKWLVGERLGDDRDGAADPGWAHQGPDAGAPTAAVIDFELAADHPAFPPDPLLKERRPLLVIVDLVLCSASDVAARGAREGAALVVVGLEPDRRVELLDLVFRGLRPLPAWILRVEAGADAEEVHRWVRRARWRVDSDDQRIEVTVWPSSGGMPH